MKQYNIVLLAFFTVIVNAFTVNAQEKTTTNGIEFVHGTFKEALAKAKKENKLVFMDCYTSWCGPCKVMSKEVFTQKEVGDYFNANFVNIKVDMEKGEGPELGKHYNITGYPTLVFMDADGKELHKHVGGLEADEFIRNAKKAFDEENISVLHERYGNGDRDNQFLLKYLETLLRAREREKMALVGQEFLANISNEQLFNAEVFGIIKTSRALKFRSELYNYILKNEEKLIAVEGISKEDYEGIIRICIYDHIFSFVNECSLEELKAEIAKAKDDYAALEDQQNFINEAYIRYYAVHEDFNNMSRVKVDQAKLFMTKIYPDKKEIGFTILSQAANFIITKEGYTFKKDVYDRLIDELKSYSTIDPNNASPNYLLAGLYKVKGDKEAAQSNITSCIEKLKARKIYDDPRNEKGKEKIEALKAEIEKM